MRFFLFVLFILLNALPSHAQLFGKKWADGKLYHVSGEVFTGQIYWTPPQKSSYNQTGDGILYRRDKSEEEIPIPASKIVSFTMGADSFVVSHDVNLTNTPFLIVMLNTPTKIYKSSTHKQGVPMMLGTGGGSGPVSLGIGLGTMVGGGTRKTYYYGANADNLTKLEKKQFMEVMSNVMADKPEVVAKIKDKTFKYGDLEELLEYYKTGKMDQKNVYDN